MFTMSHNLNFIAHNAAPNLVLTQFTIGNDEMHEKM